MMNKRGMETWIIVFWIIALVMLMLIIIWYSGLRTHAAGLLDQMIDFF